MKKLTALFIASCLAASAAPAWADWETTQWGMSPDEALVALEGATKHKFSPEEIYQDGGADYAPHVKAEWTVEGIEGTASLLFDAEERLHFVLFNPSDIENCAALEAALTERHGPADALGSDLMTISDWVDAGNAIKLTNFPSAGLCSLSYSAA